MSEVRTFSGNELAYLLGAVACKLRDTSLLNRDREVYAHLRDRLAAGMTLSPEVRRALDLDEADGQ